MDAEEKHCTLHCVRSQHASCFVISSIGVLVLERADPGWPRAARCVSRGGQERWGKGGRQYR